MKDMKYLTCDVCRSTWSSAVFVECSHGIKKVAFRPQKKEICDSCGRAMKDGDIIYTDFTPAPCWCPDCARRHGIEDFPRLRVQIGKVWATEDIRPNILK